MKNEVHHWSAHFDEIMDHRPDVSARYLQPQDGDWLELIKLKELLTGMLDPTTTEIIADFVGKFSGYEQANIILLEAAKDVLNIPNDSNLNMLQAAVDDVEDLSK